MTLNCKQGDLAYIVKSVAGNEGKVVRCVRFLGTLKFINPNGEIFEDGAWEIDPPVPNWQGEIGKRLADSQLKPIRDNDGEDEMLRIAGRPLQLENI